MKKIKYQGNLDVLRGISILLVVFYHLKLDILSYRIFPGGYLGVDIFFVISGYLISKFIFYEIYINQKFSFKNFFLRRIKRIFPALLIVMIITIPLGILFLQPIQLKQLSFSILSSLSLTSNYYFNSIATGYFAENSLLIPLLHNWSLSLEEQVYIILPILIVFLYKFKINIIKFIITIIIINFIFIHFLNIFTFYPPYIETNFHIHESNFLFKFYFTQSRLWEFLMGTLIAYIDFSKLNIKINKIFFLKYLNYLGLILIFFSFIFFNKDLPHPSYITLIPVTGVLLILFFSKDEVFVTKILTNSVIRYIGLISYSLYLWHYPIFAYVR